MVIEMFVNVLDEMVDLLPELDEGIRELLDSVWSTPSKRKTQIVCARVLFQESMCIICFSMS